MPFVDSVDNAREAIGGQDEEMLDEVKARAPDYLRTRSRAEWDPVRRANVERLGRVSESGKKKKQSVVGGKHA